MHRLRGLAKCLCDTVESMIERLNVAYQIQPFSAVLGIGSRIANSLLAAYPDPAQLISAQIRFRRPLFAAHAAHARFTATDVNLYKAQASGSFAATVLTLYYAVGMDTYLTYLTLGGAWVPVRICRAR